MADNITERVINPDDEMANRLSLFGHRSGEDDTLKQEKSNDVISATIAVKGATKHYIDNSAEARRLKSLEAGQVDRVSVQENSDAAEISYQKLVNDLNNIGKKNKKK